MNIRLTPTDLEFVRIIQEHLVKLRPLPIHLGAAETVRAALRKTAGEIDFVRAAQAGQGPSLGLAAARPPTPTSGLSALAHALVPPDDPFK